MLPGDAMDLYFRAALSQGYYHFIDVDGFGTGMPHSAEAIWVRYLPMRTLRMFSTDIGYAVATCPRAREY